MTGLEKMQALAEEVVTALDPYCVPGQCVIAGSIRRRKENPRDIEVVAIPRRVVVQQGLFGGLGALGPDPGFVRVVNQWPRVKGYPTGKYTQRLLPGGVKLDLFIARPDNWGLILAIRTGSVEWVRRTLAASWSRQGYKSESGMLMRAGRPYPTSTERGLFSLLTLPWVEPWQREAYEKKTIGGR